MITFPQIKRAMVVTAREAVLTISAPGYWRFRDFRRGIEEPEMAVLESLCPRDCVTVDVGANYGMYTTRLLSLSKECWAFEPIPRLARLLRRGFRGTGLHVEGVALGDREGHVELRVPRFHEGYSTIEPTNDLEGKTDSRWIDVFKVPLRTLDSYGLTRVALLKVDVEGHEENVLRGACELLRTCRPALLVEIEERHRSGSVQGVSSFLRGYGYRRNWVCGGRLEPCDEVDIVEHQRRLSPTQYVRNFVFLPTP